MISLNYRDSRPIYEQIKEGFKKLIATGAIGPDEKLPSVRALATQLSINPNTIQRAYAALESEGYTYSVPANRGDADLAHRTELLQQFRALSGELLGLGVSREELEALVKEVAL